MRLAQICVFAVLSAGSLAIVPSAVAAPSIAEANSTTFDFPSNDSTVIGFSGIVNSTEVGFFWSAARGDRVSETFTGPTSVNRAILSVEVVTNLLTSGAEVDWNLEINGIVVGSFVVHAGFTGPITLDVNFPAITGPTYDVTLRVTNEVALASGSHTLAYAGAFAHSIELFEAVQEVTIDIKPKSATNPITLSGHGSIPVAILSTDTFDATTVDPGTVCFGDAEDPSQRDCTTRKTHIRDVNRDGRADLLLRFEVSQTGIDPGDTTACLTGQTLAGESIEGCDSIQTR